MIIRKQDEFSAGLAVEIGTNRSIATLPPPSLVKARKDGDETGAEDEKDV